MSDLVSVSVTETGESPFAVRIVTGGHIVVGDEPASMGAPISVRHPISCSPPRWANVPQ